MKAVARDVMFALPVWVSETATFKEIAAKLRGYRVSAFPVLDADGKVTGVVSEADLLVKEAVQGEPGGVRGLIAALAHRAERAKAAGVTAADLMTSPAVTVGPNDTVEHAAQLMLTRKVKRLPVVDGVVTLEGNPETVAIGHDLVWRARHVEGVVAVRDRLVYPVPPVPVAPGPYF